MNFTFLIPLRSAKVASDWGRVCRLLEATVGSALASRDAAVKVVIACDEIPSISQAADPRVTFLSKAYPMPETPAHQMLDKRFKKFDLLNHAIEDNSGYIMLLDSDDLVSAKLANYVLHANNRRGHLISSGYIADTARKEVSDLDEFDRHCGSCVVVYLDSSDRQSTFNWPLYLTVTRHRDFGQLSKHTSRPLEPVPFRAVMALKNHGQNHSDRVQVRGKQWLTRHFAPFRRRSKSRSLDPETAHEFGLVW